MTSNYGASHEIDAYRAQFAANGFLEYCFGIEIQGVHLYQKKVIDKILDINLNMLLKMYKPEEKMFLYKLFETK